MDDWERLLALLPEKEDYYSHLNMEKVTDVDYTHRKRACKDFERTNLGEYDDLYFQSDTLLLADVFEKFRDIYLEIFELHPARIFTVAVLVFLIALKKTKLNLDLSTDIDLLLMVEKCIRRVICRDIHQYVTANNKYMTDYYKNKESSYLKYWDINDS